MALTKAQVLAKSGRAPLAYRELEPFREELLRQGSGPHVLLFIAEMAGQASKLDARRALEIAMSCSGHDRESLQLALRLARQLQIDTLSDLAANELLRRYPDSDDAVKAVVVPSLAAGRLEEARDRLSDMKVQTPLTRYLLAFVEAASLPTTDWKAFASSPEAKASVGEPIAVLDGLRFLLRTQGLDRAITLLTSHHWIDSYIPDALDIGLKLLERSNLLREEDRAGVEPGITALVRWLFEQVARRPGDGDTRIDLARLLSSEMCGLSGIVTALSHALNKYTGSVAAPVEPVAGLPRSELNAAFKAFCDQCRSNPMLGLAKVDVSDRDRCKRFLASLADILEYTAQAGSEDPEFIGLLTHVGVSVGRSMGEREEWKILRLSANALAASNERQQARNMAEHALKYASATSSPADMRAAWLIFADTYHRTGNVYEAVIGLALARSISVATLDHQQAYSEPFLAARLAREIGLTEIALSAVREARSTLLDGDLHQTNGLHLDNLELSIRFGDLMRHWKSGPSTETKETLVACAQAAVSLAERAVALETDDLPPLFILGQLMAVARNEGMALEASLQESWDRALRRQSAERAARLKAIVDGDMAALLSARSKIEGSLHASDLARDSAEADLIVRRLLGHDPLPDTGTTAFLIEWLSDHSIRNVAELQRDASEASDLADWVSRAGHNLTGDEIHRLVPEIQAQAPVSPKAPRLPPDAAWTSGALEQIRSRSVDIHLLGLNAAGRLVRVSRIATGSSVVVEAGKLFSAAQASRFSAKYPYGFGLLDRAAPDGLNEVLAAMSGLELSVLPGDRPSLLIVDRDLQGIPANLLVVAGDLWGRSCGLGSAPSLTWLSAAHASPRVSTGRRTAWIPDDASDDGLPTLSVLRERVAATLVRHGFDMLTGTRLPEELGGSDIVLVGAHGSVNDGGRYFRNVAGERDTRLSARRLARACRNAGLAILAICHAGRLDGEPFGEATNGLARLLLDHGCRAVVASPWALDTAVLSDWLPAFLESLEAGEPVVTANFKANLAVCARRSHPADHLAMHVYGDPLFALEPRRG